MRAAIDGALIQQKDRYKLDLYTFYFELTRYLETLSSNSMWNGFDHTIKLVEILHD